MSKAKTGEIRLDLLGTEPRKTLKCNSTDRLFDNAQRRTPRYANPADAIFFRLTLTQFPETSQNMHMLVTVQMGKSPRVNTMVSAEQQLPPNLRADRGPHRLPPDE